MNPISAADNHSIHSANARWRLLHNEKPLAEASPRGFRYGARFGSSRRLNESGVLERSDILQVILGWQQTDESWHLGLILAPQIAEERGSRWCELVAWPDPEIHVFQDLAQQAGQELAQALEVPFYVIPPQRQVESLPLPDLPALPLNMGDWTLERGHEKGQLLIQRGGAWGTRKLMRVGWYALWVLIYVVVSVASLNSKIALPNTGTLLPNPHLLPYFGLGVAGFIFMLMSYHLWLYFNEPNEIRLDSSEGTISAWKGEKCAWLLSASEVQSVYVSKALSNSRSSRQGGFDYGELNLHLGGGKFHFILKEKEGSKRHAKEDWQDNRFEEGIYELSRRDIGSEMQAAALYIGEALGNLPVWLDIRPKNAWF